MITVDYYKEDDFKGLFKLWDQWKTGSSLLEGDMEYSISSIMKTKDNILLIAKDEFGVQGYAQIAKCFYLGFEPFIEVIQLLVSEDKRSSGIGSLMMKFIEDEAVKENINVVKLSSQVQRSRAHIFYERLGYDFYKISKFYEKKLN